MAEFNAADAGLEGMRLTREQPRAVLVWAGLMFLAALVFSTILIGVGGDAYNELLVLQQSRRRDPEEAVAAFARLGPALLLLAPLALAFYAVLYSAIYRAILRPEDGGPGFLRFGGDEVRVLGATVLLVLLYVGLAIAAGVLLAVLGAVASMAGGFAAGLVAFLGVIALIVGMIYVVVRFSLALPATFAERRIRVFESWRLTKGRFWPLLGAYVLAIALSIIIGLLALMIYFAIAALIAGGVREAGAVFRPDYASIGDWLTPAMIVYLIVNSVVNAVTTAVILAPSAIGYRDFGGAPAAPSPG